MSYSEYQSIPIHQDYYNSKKLNSTCNLGKIAKEGEKSQKQTVRLHLVKSYLKKFKYQFKNLINFFNEAKRKWKLS